MPGHNHYPWCTCGWCVKYAYARAKSAAISDYFIQYSARSFLKQHGASQSYTACFVNPNASCPVCGAAVFYYQNASGSRVYFDELGPPWPKHPCTDQKPPMEASGQRAARPIKRTRGLMIELLEKKRLLSDNETAILVHPESSEAWTLVEVTAIQRSGFLSTVDAQFIGADGDKWIKFNFNSPEPKLAIGDIFNIRGSEISIFDISAMKPRTYKIVVLDIEVSSGS